MSPILAAQIFVFFITIATLFQLALAVGMPWGELAMGGKYPGRFSPKLRVAAAIQMVFLAGLGVIVLTRAGMILPEWLPLSRRLIWVVVAFCGISAVLNLITPSKWERILWAPVTIILLFSSFIVAQAP